MSYIPTWLQPYLPNWEPTQEEEEAQNQPPSHLTTTVTPDNRPVFSSRNTDKGYVISELLNTSSSDSSSDSSSEEEIRFNDPKVAIRKYSASRSVDDGMVSYGTVDLDLDLEGLDDVPRPRISDLDLGAMPQERPKKLSNWKRKVSAVGTPIIKDLSLRQKLDHHVFPTPKSRSQKDDVSNLYVVRKESFEITGYDVEDTGYRSERKRTIDHDDQRTPRKRVRENY